MSRQGDDFAGHGPIVRVETDNHGNEEHVYHDDVEVKPVIKDDEGLIEQRNKAKLHRVYFKDYQVEYLESVQDAEKITFGEAVRMLIDNEIGQFEIFAKLTGGQAIVITADGKLTVVENVEFTEDTAVPMTSKKAHEEGGMFYG